MSTAGKPPSRWAGAVVLLALAAGGCKPGTPATGAGSAAAPTSVPQPPAELRQILADGERTALAGLPAGPGQSDVAGSCMSCHGAAMIQQQHKDSTGWAKTVTLMRSWGSPLAEDKVPAVIGYLTTHYGVTPR